MKTIDLSCASPASTAICSSMDQRSMVRRVTRSIDHGYKSRNPIPCSSHLPVDPKLLYYQRTQNSSHKQSDLRGKSSADITYSGQNSSDKQSDLRGKSSIDITDSGSLKFVLDHKPLFDLIFDSQHVTALVPSQPMWMRSNGSPSKSLSNCSRSPDQVVELMVSIHCKGCEGKVRRHISRMEGVKSFSIDIDTKKVTIIGDITPLGVLTSISRVKNAQLWPSPISSSSSS